MYELFLPTTCGNLFVLDLCAFSACMLASEFACIYLWSSEAVLSEIFLFLFCIIEYGNFRGLIALCRYLGVYCKYVCLFVSVSLDIVMYCSGILGIFTVFLFIRGNGIGIFNCIGLEITFGFFFAVGISLFHHFGFSPRSRFMTQCSSRSLLFFPLPPKKYSRTMLQWPQFEVAHNWGHCTLIWSPRLALGVSIGDGVNAVKNLLPKTRLFRVGSICVTRWSGIF